MFKKNNEPTIKTLGILLRVSREEEKQESGAFRYHFNRTTGNGRFTKISTVDTYHLESLLRKFDIPHTKGNDAPRGGRLGDYIEIPSWEHVEQLFNKVHGYAKEQAKQAA